MWLQGPSNWSVSNWPGSLKLIRLTLWPGSLKLIYLALWPGSLKLICLTLWPGSLKLIHLTMWPGSLKLIHLALWPGSLKLIHLTLWSGSLKLICLALWPGSLKLICLTLWPGSLKLIRLTLWPGSLKLISHTVTQVPETDLSHAVTRVHETDPSSHNVTWSVVVAVSVKLCKTLRQSISSCDLVCDNYIWHHIIMEPFHCSVLRWHDLTCCNCYHAELSFWDHVSPWGGAGRFWVKGLCTQKDEDVVKVSKQGRSLTRLAFCQSFHCRLLQNSATENLALLLCEWQH